MVKASITLDGIAAMKPEDIRACGRAAMRVVGATWIANYLPLHFTNAATARYGYAQRARYYRYRKRNKAEINGIRAIGEDKPLVFSGRSRERAKRARMELKNSGSLSSVVGEVVIDAPALNFQPARKNTAPINMRDEVTRVIQSEIDDLSKVFLGEFERQLEQRGRRTRRTRKAA